MPLYRFKISDSSGAVSEQLIEGDSQEDAMRRLQRRGVFPLEFMGEGSMAAAEKGTFGFRRRFDTVDFTDRLVPLIEAGIPLERALGIVAEGTEKQYDAGIVADLRRGLHEGRSFSDLIHDRGRLFPRLFASVVEAGEEAGALPQVMSELRRFLTQRREFNAFLLSASIYPLFILAASACMLAVLIGVVVPKFAAVLASTGQDLPPATFLLIRGSELSRTYWWIPVVAIVCAALLLRQTQREGATRNLYDRVVLSIPLVGRAVLMANLARMARTMAILMRSGVHLLDTVAIARKVLQNEVLSQSVSGLVAELRQGEKLSHALANSRHIPPFMLRMVAVGEETGEVEEMLERVAQRYEADLKRLTKRCLALFEPIVIICLGLLVGLVVLLMFLAIMEMQGGI